MYPWAKFTTGFTLADVCMLTFVSSIIAPSPPVTGLDGSNSILRHDACIDYAGCATPSATDLIAISSAQSAQPRTGGLPPSRSSASRFALRAALFCSISSGVSRVLLPSLPFLLLPDPPPPRPLAPHRLPPFLRAFSLMRSSRTHPSSSAGMRPKGTGGSCTTHLPPAAAPSGTVAAIRNCPPSPPLRST